MTPDAAERRARALQRLREDTARRMDAMPTTHDDDVRTLIAAHDALADALRAAEARAVAAEGAIALLSRTLGCESDDPAGIVQEALDYAAEQRERADDRDEALVERDAAEARLAALAGAVDAVRAAHATATEAGAQYRAAWDAVDATPTIPQSEAIAAALRVSYEAQETLDTALTTLLRGAPGGYVEARVVRAYLDALDVLPGDLATINAACEREREARAALDAALLAATTTPTEGHRP